MVKRRNPITGQWSARPIAMQRSYSWRVLSRAAHQCLSRIEIELADHGGNDIDELPVTFDDFVAYGLHRSAIAPALAELEALGFIDITQRGVAARAADDRRPNKFRLLTRPWEKKGSPRPRWDKIRDTERCGGRRRRGPAQRRERKIRQYGNRTKEGTETVPKGRKRQYGNRTTSKRRKPYHYLYFGGRGLRRRGRGPGLMRDRWAGNDVLPLALPTGWGAVVRALGPGQIRLCFSEAPAKGWLPIPSALAYRCGHSVELSTPNRHRGASAQCSALLECPACRSRAADARRLHLATRPMI